MLEFFKRNNRKKAKIESNSSIEEELLNRFENSIHPSYSDRNIKLSGNLVWQEIQTHDKQVRENVALLALSRLIDKLDNKYNHVVVRRKLFKSEFNTKTPPSKASLLKLFDLCLDIHLSYCHRLPPGDILFCFQYYKEKYGKDAHYIKARNALVKTYNDSYGDSALKKIVLGLGKLDHDANDESIFDRRDILGRHLESQWDNYDDNFKRIIAHCWALGQAAKPTKKWSKISLDLVKSNPENDKHIQFISEIFELLIKAGKAEVKRLNELPNNAPYFPKGHYYLFDTNEIALSYLIWYAAMFDHQILNILIGQLALSSYHKIKGVGSLSTKNGNACMYAFTLMSPKAGITQLLNIRNKTINKSIKNTANTQLSRKAKELGISEEALLELSVPEYNLDGNLSKWPMGDFVGIIDITDMKNPVSYWVNKKTAKKQKAAPKDIAENYWEEVKLFKSSIKDIKTAISVHAKRLENAYLDNIEWSIAVWKSNYLDHPFLSRYTSKLIWIFDEQETGILVDAEIVDFNKNPVDLAKCKKVKLWHPIYSELNTITSWRNFILANELKQPFKQAYREIYIVTDAELVTNNYSNRFAAHILYQHQFLALAKTRDWNYTLQGAFDSHNTPSRSIPNFELRAEFWVEPISDGTSPTGIYTYVASDQVRFYDNRKVLQMADVPKIVFSEIMRDVDLFVGVTSIGNNPEWEDVGERRNYWQNYSFGDLSETAKTRRDVLERILPKLKISDRCTLGEKFLTVKGKIRNYKIHLGSGNILMTPNDQYLCIVPSSKNSNSKIFLPFDNDRTLSIIISKAFLLYDDDKITDVSITRQIKF